MQAYSTLSSIFTVLSFFIFAGIVRWAWSRRRKLSFDAAAAEPFALPDEASDRDRPARTRALARPNGSSSEGVRP